MVACAAVLLAAGVRAGRGTEWLASGQTVSPTVPSLEVAPATAAADMLVMSAPVAVTWDMDDPSAVGGTASVVQLGRVGGDGPVRLRLDGTTLSASAAVVWISPAPNALVDRQLVRIALLGDALVEQDGVRRSGPNLYVTALVRGSIRVQSPSRTTRNLSTLETYQLASNLRAVAEPPTERVGAAAVARAAGEPPPRREITAVNLRPAPIRFELARAETFLGPDGRVHVLLEGGATIVQARPNGDFLELRAQRAVLMTAARSLTELAEAQQAADGPELVQAAYLEGDVRVVLTPGGRPLAQQRLQAERVYYEFDTDRAVLTDAVLHTVDPQRNLPVVVRAHTVRQLAQGEYSAERVELSTSSFAVPTYSVRASRMYVRQVPAAFEGDRGRTLYRADHLTLRTLGLPVLYFPLAGGDASNQPLRSVGMEQSDRFGFGVRTNWGLYEVLGRPHPRDLDITFRADYLDRRGPATGVDAEYRGGLVTETTAEPWNFEGRLRSYLILDRASDDFGGSRRNVDSNEDIRGRILFEHQHFLPEDWHVQLRAGYASDATFLEQFFQSEFETQLPYELSFYAKRQRDTEQLSLLAVTTLNNFPTAAELVQEQTFVQRYPELAYRRVGDSVVDDRFTFFSDNVASVLSFRNAGTSLFDQGYPAGLSPGLPSIGQTGTDEDTVLRGDFRQQLDYPFFAGPFKVVPYVVGRYTPYSDGLEGGAENRLYGAAGARVATAFWQTNDAATSRLFDIQRTRHVVEPAINLYTSGTTVDRTKVFIYDEPIDAVNDVSAAQLQLLQRWQTKRGGPGRWRSVDFLTLNVEGNFFTNQPSKAQLDPTDFRGLFYASLPEASIPRNSMNADAQWRISDTTLVLADQQFNLDDSRLATVAAGLAVQRDPRVAYYLEQRYVEPLNSNITTFRISYLLSAKYSVDFNQSYDFSQTNNVNTSFTVNRRFDRLLASVTVYTDSVNDETGVRFLLLPEGLNPRGASAFFGALQTRDRR